MIVLDRIIAWVSRKCGGMAHAQDYARRGFVSRIAAYKACMMEKGYVLQ